MHRDANSMYRKIDEQIYTMYSLLGKSQHHVDFERQADSSEQGGGESSQITDKDL